MNAGHSPQKQKTHKGSGRRSTMGRVCSNGSAGNATLVGHVCSEGLASGEGTGKGAISLLQEFVQCSKQFQAPQHRPILQWSFDQRMVDFTTLEFRALVAFVLDGVPHHVAGAWHPSKKPAQRDAAERALGFFITVWGEQLLKQWDQAKADTMKVDAGSARRGAWPAGDEALPECQALEEYCRTTQICDGPGHVQWGVAWDGSRCRAEVEIEILGVAHKFAGAPRASTSLMTLRTSSSKSCVSRSSW